jgi:hypothetical protein
MYILNRGRNLELKSDRSVRADEPDHVTLVVSLRTCLYVSYRYVSSMIGPTCIYEVVRFVPLN